MLLFLILLAGRHSDRTSGFCLFPLLCVPLDVPTDFSGYLILVERGTGRNEHGAVVEWISAYVWCLVSACSSSWYVLYLFVRFFLSTRVTSGWIFEISLSANSINQSTKETCHTFLIIV